MHADRNGGAESLGGGGGGGQGMPPSRPSAYDLDGEFDVTISTNDMYNNHHNNHNSNNNKSILTSPSNPHHQPPSGASPGPRAVGSSPAPSAVRPSPVPMRSPSPPQVKGVLSSTNNMPLNNQPQVTRLIHCERPFDGRGVMSYIGTTHTQYIHPRTSPLALYV